jgi:hypothetical protein
MGNSADDDQQRPIYALIEVLRFKKPLGNTRQMRFEANQACSYFFVKQIFKADAGSTLVERAEQFSECLVQIPVILILRQIPLAGMHGAGV